MQHHPYQMEDSELSPLEEFRCGITDILARLRSEDLPKVFRSSSSFNDRPELKKVFLEVLAERYEAEIELLNSQEISYEFRDPRAFLESLLPPKREEIPLLVDVQEEDDPAPRSHSEDVAENAIIEAT